MITLTESAAKRIASQIANNDAIALRFGAKESGCSGYAYVMDFARTIEPEDAVFELTRFWQKNVDGDRFMQGLQKWLKS